MLMLNAMLLTTFVILVTIAVGEICDARRVARPRDDAAADSADESAVS
jgi:hypothetical protein